MVHRTTVLMVALCFLHVVANSKCHNNTDIRYILSEPTNIINYFGTCSQFTKRTCCAPKNLQTITKKVKKAVQSIDMSLQCQRRIKKAICSVCDGDWGEKYYEGICVSYCSSLYDACQNDYFVIDPATQKIRGCRDDDLFCWKLYQIIDDKQGNESSRTDKGDTFCELLDLTLPEDKKDQQGCWRGQISSQVRGRAPKTLDFKKVKAKKKAESFMKFLNSKEAIYGAIIVILGCIWYKVFWNKRKPKLYSLR